MSLKTPAIPEPMKGNELECLRAIREAIEVTKGRRGLAAPITALGSSASTAEIIAKLNEVIARLQS